jgi:PTH1 family peptidyl-tRNA hydrolase
VNRLIVGLGNPGKKYENSKHNIGFLVLGVVENPLNLYWKEKFKGLFATFTKGEDNTYFLKPQTFMNLSGESVQPLAHFFKVETKDILVIHDELDLPFGTLAFKKGGGLAGHNGLKSIAAILGTQDFMRLRMGIGRPEFGETADYVLSPFKNDDNMFLKDYLSGAAAAVKKYMDHGFEAAATEFSRKKIV